MSDTKRRRLLAAAVMFSGAYGAPALAQVLQEVIVTAQRREESIQDAAVSVSALSGSQLSDLGINSTSDLSARTPGLIMSQTSSGSLHSLPTIRGVTQNDFSQSQEPPNALYIDEAYYSSPNALAFGLFDVNRVEVLRGPQGTLYGRNSTGGLLSFVSNRPTDRFAASADLTYGAFDQTRFEGMVNGPLAEGWSGRLAVLADYHDGYIENELPGDNDTATKKFQAARASLAYDKGGVFDALLTLSASRMPEHRDGGYQHKPGIFTAEGLGADNPAYPDDPTATDFAGGRDPYPDPHKGVFNDHFSLKNRMIAPTLRLNWNLDGLSLTSVTSYQSFRFDYADDDDASPVDTAFFAFGQRLKQWSEEIRVSGQTESLQWQTGVYFLDIETKNYNNYAVPDPDVFIPILGVPVEFNEVSDFRIKTRSWAVFAQGEYFFIPQWSVTAGARYTKDRKKGFAQTVFLEPAAGLVYDFSEPNAGGLTRLSDNAYSAKLQLNYRPTDDVLLYAGATRGNKFGGFNAPLDGGTSIEDTPYGDETLTSYEAGWKTTLLGGALRVNGAAFYYDYEDYQAYDFTGISSFINNYDAKIYGGELEVIAQPADGMDIAVGVSVLDSTVYDVPGGRDPVSGDLIIRDREAPQAPKVSANWLVRKAWEVGAGEFSAQIDGNYVAERYSGITNSPAVHMSSYALWNARVGYSFADERMELSVFVKNLADEDAQVYAFDQVGFFGYNLETYGPPRWWGVQFKYRTN